MARPLEDVLILDLTWVLSGPYAAMILCDLGANVIKIERPPYGDVARTTGPYKNGWSGYFFSINRGKRSVAIDLQKDEGRGLFLQMADKADVVMENFTPGTLERLGLGFDVLSSRNSGLVLARTSGFGQTGPYRDRPALDIIVQAMGGVMSITGEVGGGPVRPGVSYGDITAGLYTTIGILSALHERERTGRGQVVDISMLDCQVSVLENAIVRLAITGSAPGPLGTRHPSATPFQAFPTADGHIVVALAFGDVDQWSLLLGLLGLTELVGDERFNTGPKRTARHSELEALLLPAFRKKTTGEWLQELLELGIPCGPLNTVDDVVSDPQVRARGMIQEVTQRTAGALPIANTPLQFSESEAGIAGAPPEMGEHTREVLRELLQLSDTEIDSLEASGAVASSGGPDVSKLL
ncbi:MAG TPA: CaiB/BaiF CoA-transferase family protein, partial [Dehalococcoidia bacterium]|nr:CaiB/BaiF CoA-transferase family protein [Dehalococcoidia bacterium]